MVTTLCPKSEKLKTYSEGQRKEIFQREDANQILATPSQQLGRRYEDPKPSQPGNWMVRFLWGRPWEPQRADTVSSAEQNQSHSLPFSSLQGSPRNPSEVLFLLTTSISLKYRSLSLIIQCVCLYQGENTLWEDTGLITKYAYL